MTKIRKIRTESNITKLEWMQRGIDPGMVEESMGKKHDMNCLNQKMERSI
jgi:hypothetical protein